MTDRLDITENMIKYLNQKLNCSNVIDFIEQQTEKEQPKKIAIGSTIVAYEIRMYKNMAEAEKTDFRIFDFTVNANFDGYGYFPNIYGVLNCTDDDKLTSYIFYEAFKADLLKLFEELTHPSEWYDIVFQLIMINYYIENIRKYQYTTTLAGHLYRKLAKPYYQTYNTGGYQYSVNHKFLIVLWDMKELKKISDADKPSVRNIDLLENYLTENSHKLKIAPSTRILTLLHEVRINPKDTAQILYKYYGESKESKP